MIMHQYHTKASRRNLAKAIAVVAKVNREIADRKAMYTKLCLENGYDFDQSDSLEDKKRRDREDYLQEQFNIAMGLDG